MEADRRNERGRRQAEDLTGQRFGFLLAKTYIAGTKESPRSKWVCVCDCGKEIICKAENLKRGKIKSCGCKSNEMRRLSSIKHGHTRYDGYVSGAYGSWASMKQRCENENNAQFNDYGGRGITICERWKSFENFLADMGDRPEGMSLDRVDPNGNYEPGNCKWSTRSEQAINKRKRVTHAMVMGVIVAAKRVVAANDNAPLPQDVEDLREAIKKYEGLG